MNDKLHVTLRNLKKQAKHLKGELLKCKKKEKFPQEIAQGGLLLNWFSQEKDRADIELA